MLSLIISSPDKSKRREYILTHCRNLKIHTLDTTFIEKDTTIKNNINSIGIEDVKQMQKKLYLKPFKSKTKAIIIDDAHLLTTQAQNACLKILEEPPNNTIIILSTNTKESLLPTILSRCQTIELKTETKKPTDKQQKELEEFINNLPTMTIGERFKKAEQLAKDKEKTQTWLTNLILLLHTSLINRHPGQPHSAGESPQTTLGIASKAERSQNLFVIPSEERVEESHTTELEYPNYLNLLKTLQALHQTLKTTNTNPRFALEHTLLQIH